ncbi:MAG: hypothetical protein WC645_06675 [Candidatus Margulisiibacteriota bacterium]
MVDSPFLMQVGGGVIIPIPPIPPEDFSSLEAINRDIMNSVERYRQTNQAPRDGDFYAHLGGLGLGMEYNTAVGQVTRPSPGQSNWRAICTVSALRLEAQIHASRGRFLRELKFYAEADAEFSNALSIYNALIEGNPVPPRGGAETQLHTFARTINGQIRSALENKTDIVNEMKVERAEIQIAMLRPDNYITDEMIYRPLSDDEFNGILAAVTHDFSGPRGALDENIRNSVTRSQVAEASFLLELAKRLRVRNMDHAHTVVDRAIEICLQELNAGHGDSEVRLSALLTLAWAYNTKASLMEEAESGTGKEFALKTAAIYTFLLFGQTGLAGDEDLISTLQNSPELQTLFSRNAGEIEVISRSLESVLQGGPIKTSGTDILQRNATNELELYLNLANAMSLARKYDGELGALTILDKLQDLQPRLNPQVELRDSFFQRVQLADASINMAYLSRLYGETRDLNLLGRFHEIEAELQTTLTWFSQKINGLEHAGADIKQIDQYSLDFFRGYDTLAWVYSTLGRIQKNEQGIWNGLAETDYLALAENYYQAVRLQDSQQVDGDDFATLANSLSHLMRGTDDLSDRLIKMEIETYITWPQAYLHRGELDRELENFETALEELGQVTVDDAAYYSARLSIAEIKLVEAQRIFTWSGNLEGTNGAVQKLNELLNDPILSSLWIIDLNTADNEIRSEVIRAQLLKARIYEARGRLAMQTLDQAAANSEFDSALEIYQQLIDNQEIRNTLEKEMFITVDQLRLSQADILKAKGESDINILGEAETEFAALTFDPATLRGMEAEISHWEMLALQNKYYITQGLYHDHAEILTAEQEIQLTNQIQTLLAQGAYRLAYRALGVYAWLLNQRGKIAELTRGEGRGREDYQKAAELYASLLANSVLSDNRFLILSGVSRGQLLLSRAETLKSAAAQGSEGETSLLYSLHQDADVAYEQALDAFDEINQDQGNQLYYLTSLIILDAQSGRAENRIAWGRLQEEEEELTEARSSYLQALGFLTPALQHLVEQQKVSYLNESRVGLRATTALAWALDSLGEHLEDFTCSSGAENAPAEYRAALLIYSSLVENELPGEWAVRDRELPPGIEFSGLLGFVALSRSALLDPQVLYAAETNIWRLRLNYLFALKALKDDATAIYAAEDYIEEAGEPQNLEDKRFLIMALKIVGDVYCWNMEEYDQAEPYYEKAQTYLEQILSGELVDRELISLRHQIWMGRAQIYYEREDWGPALGLLRQVIEEIKKNEPHPRGDNLLALVNAYLMIGNVYLYELEDENAAQPYFEQLLELAPGNLRIYSNACLGIAAAYLARENYEQARGYYEKVIALDTPDITSVAIKLNLARARVGLSRILARDGQITEAQSELAKAQALVEGFSCLRVEKLLDEIEDTGYFWRERREQAVGVGFEAGHAESTFRGRESIGENYQLTLNVPLTEDLEYTSVLELSTDERGYGERSDSLGRTLPRLYSDTAGSFLNSFLYNQEENNFNLRMRLDLNLNFYGYEVHNYNPQDSLANAVYANAVIQAAAGVDWKLKPPFLPRSTVLLGVEAGGGVLAGFNENPATAAQRASLIDQASPELDALTDPNAFLYNWFVQPMARWIFPSFDITDDVRVTNFSIGVGGLFGEDQISTSNEGFWTLGDVDSHKLAFKGSLGLTLAIGDQQRWQIPLEFNAEYGNYTYLQGSLGVGYNFDEALLEFLLWGSYFERQGEEPLEPIQPFEGDNDIQTWDINFGAAVHF